MKSEHTVDGLVAIRPLWSQLSDVGVGTAARNVRYHRHRPNRSEPRENKRPTTLLKLMTVIRQL